GQQQRMESLARGVAAAERRAFGATRAFGVGWERNPADGGARAGRSRSVLRAEATDARDCGLSALRRRGRPPRRLRLGANLLPGHRCSSLSDGAALPYPGPRVPLAILWGRGRAAGAVAFGVAPAPGAPERWRGPRAFADGRWIGDGAQVRRDRGGRWPRRHRGGAGGRAPGRRHGDGAAEP